MKKLFILFSFMFCVSGWGQDVASQFLPLETGTDEYNSYKLSATKAQNYIDEGMSNLNEKGKNLAFRVIDVLSRAKFHVSINSITEQLCTNLGAGAFVSNHILDVIFICKKVRDRIQNSQSENDLKLMAQLFVHEGVHLTGIEDECATTYFEVSIMKNTKDGLLYRGNINKYQTVCNFKL